MVPDIQPRLGRDTRGLLGYLYGAGRHDEHEDPHIVAAWLDRGVPDPGRDPEATLTELARFLDVPVKRLLADGGTRKNGHVWHCPVAIAPTDRLLSDAEWGMVARRIVHAAGIAPSGDQMACRWIAVRHDPRHIHIVATAVREDGRAPRRHKDGQRAQAECRKLEVELGLRRLKSGDKTASRRPTSPEVHKAQGQGWEEPSRVWLQEQIREALAVTSSPQEFFDLLEGGLGVHIHQVRKNGELVGYRVSRPGDINAAGRPVWFAAGKLALDLSWPNVEARLAANPAPEEHPTARRTRAEHPLLAYTDALDRHLVPALLADTGEGNDGATAQAYIAAFHESLTVLAAQAPPDIAGQLKAAQRQLARATRSQVRADHARTREFRYATRQLVDLATSESDSGAADLFAIALAGVLFAALLAQDWHARRHHQQQTDAAHSAVIQLQAAVEQVAEQPLTK
ncbi:mobilization protein [Streptacidiphilus sp. 4-A2]|nr:mobilization protein [Streptacidiphilus sp. 4-A2]